MNLKSHRLTTLDPLNSFVMFQGWDVIPNKFPGENLCNHSWIWTTHDLRRPIRDVSTRSSWTLPWRCSIFRCAVRWWGGCHGTSWLHGRCHGQQVNFPRQGESNWLRLIIHDLRIHGGISSWLFFGELGFHPKSSVFFFQHSVRSAKLNETFSCQINSSWSLPMISSDSVNLQAHGAHIVYPAESPSLPVSMIQPFRDRRLHQCWYLSWATTPTGGVLQLRRPFGPPFPSTGKDCDSIRDHWVGLGQKKTTFHDKHGANHGWCVNWECFLFLCFSILLWSLMPMESFASSPIVSYSVFQ